METKITLMLTIVFVASLCFTIEVVAQEKIDPEGKELVDVLHLKNGEIVKGKVISKSLLVLRFQHQNGEISVYKKSKIKEITKEKFSTTQPEVNKIKNYSTHKDWSNLCKEYSGKTFNKGL